jgi:dihydrofolate reductase
MGKVKLIVAMTSDSLIGDRATNSLPWPKVSGELVHFRETTVGHGVLMGRRTFESIPAPRGLPSRQNIVLSRGRIPFWDYEILDRRNLDQPDFSPWWHWNMRTAIRDFQNVFPQKDLFVIGGRDIFNLALSEDLVDEAIVSYIPGTYPAQEPIYFPTKFDGWAVVNERPMEKFNIVTYRKK